MIPVEINTQFYAVPVFDFDVLEVKSPDSCSSYSKEVAPKEIEVPEGGIEVHFKTGGGQECAPCYFVTTSFEHEFISMSPAERELRSGFMAAKAEKIKMDADMEIVWALRQSIVNAEPAAMDSPVMLEEPKTVEDTAEYIEKLRAYMSAVAK